MTSTASVKKARMGMEAKGLKRLELWAYPETFEEIKEAAAKITRRALKRRAKPTEPKA